MWFPLPVFPNPGELRRILPSSQNWCKDLREIQISQENID
jgi:hypothetical protein